MINKKLILALNALLVLTIFSTLVLAAESTVCCERTKATSANGVLFCQNVPVSECDASSKQVPTSCESTSYCKPGVCYNSNEGTCLDNTPEIVCKANGGIWSQDSVPQCELGCCVLGDQAAFVTLTRCKKLSSFFGLQTNYKKSIKTEVECILEVQNQEKGACIYEIDFEKTCRFTTREDCSSGANSTRGQFFASKLCSAEELGTPCAPTRETMCVAGKDEVYFKDSCGNPANIYDSSKLEDKRYWSEVLDRSESCSSNSNTGNANSKSCGNCNYLQGTICRIAERGNKPTYGNNICTDLNCEKTQNGNSYKHGESWCVFEDAGTINKGTNAVGSRFYKHICINGEEVLEQCADFRQEECIEDKIETTFGDFSQAACRVNRWQDCTSQTEKIDCENTDRRDCIWKAGINFLTNSTDGVCVPKNSPD